MKKLLTSFAVVSVLATAGVEVGQHFNQVSQAATRNAVKSYKFDKNTITNGESNFRSYRYARIPSWSRQTGYQNQQVGGGWNFITYLHTNFYSGGY